MVSTAFTIWAVLISAAASGFVAYFVGSLRAHNQWRKMLTEEILPTYQTKEECKATHEKVDSKFDVGSGTFVGMQIALARICDNLNIDCPELRPGR